MSEEDRILHEYCWKDMLKMSSINTWSSGGAVTGAISGAALAALISWLGYRNKSKQPTWKRWLKGIGWTALGAAAGGAMGTYAGRMIGRHIMHNRTRKEVENGLDGNKVGGRVMYVDFPRNVVVPKEVEGTNGKIVKTFFPDGIPVGHAALCTIDDKNGIMTVQSIGVKTFTASKELGNGLVTAGNAFGNDYLVQKGRHILELANNQGMPKLKTYTFNVKGMDDNGILNILNGLARDKKWGDEVVIHEGDRCDDIRLPQRFLERYYENTVDPGGGGYSPFPGGYNCGTAAREAFDIAQKSSKSHYLDMLWGGGSTANAPSVGTIKSNKAY